MFLSTPVKIFYAAVLFSLILAGCSSSGVEQNSTSIPIPPRKSDLPFSTREPDVFQVDIVIKTGDRERLVSIAREGSKRRVTYDVGTDDQRTVVRTDKEYLLFAKRRAYVERELSSAAPQSELGSYLLITRPRAEFEEVGREGTVVQYKAVINESGASEVVIFYDEAIGMPVKQEFYSTRGDDRKLRYSVELRNFKTSVDVGAFEIPSGFHRENGSAKSD
jgi:hypothetical protein